MPSLDSADVAAQRASQLQQAELVERIARFAPNEGVQATRIERLHLFRTTEARPCAPVVYEPRLAFVAQGSKLAVLENETYRYDPLHYLVVSMPLPVRTQIIDATPEKPYLALRLDIDLEEIGSLMLNAPVHAPPTVGVDRALYAARMNSSLLDAVLRLMRTLDTPEDAPVLAPLAMREIYYRVLTGELGQRLRDLATAGSRSNRVGRAVALLRRNYLEPLSIEELAQSLHMSSSSLHHQFKAATSMSPLQFQKRLRLHEARRLMVVDGVEASAAAHRVGYESASQFSREYKRLFGAPPRAEIGQYRGVRSA
jgi:AraC-like DNA-binding protein